MESASSRVRQCFDKTFKKDGYFTDYDIEVNWQISSILLNHISKPWVELHHVQPWTFGCRCFTVLLQGGYPSDPSQVPLQHQRRGLLSLVLAVDVTPSHTFLHSLQCLFCSTTFANSQRQLFLHLELHSEMSWATEQASGFCYPHYLQNLIKGKGRGGEVLGAKIWNRKNGSAVCFKNMYSLSPSVIPSLKFLFHPLVTTQRLPLPTLLTALAIYNTWKKVFLF